MIEFVPSLPESKQKAFQCMKMLNGCKTIACYKERLWPLDCGLIFCTNSKFSQVRALDILLDCRARIIHLSFHSFGFMKLEMQVHKVRLW